jgi:hypothetical protein
MRIPDYQGGGIVNLMASIQAGLGGPVSAYPVCALLAPDRIAAHRQVLLLVVDGLGFNYLRSHPQAVCLNAHLAGGLTSVFPSTTSTAITTYLTGDAPQQHGLTGWHMYFRELGSVLAVLPGRPRFGGVGLADAGIDVRRFLEARPFSERIPVAAHTVSPAAIARSGFNLAHLGSARLHPYSDLDDMVNRCADLLRQPGRKYVYAYWPMLDALGHEHGIHSARAVEHLAVVDRACARLLELAKGTDTLLLVTADHGQIDPPAGHRIDLADHPELAACLALPLCGEPRVAYCYLRPGCETVFDDYVRQHLAGVAENHAPERLIAAGWFGQGRAHDELANRLGDRVLVMQGDYILVDRLPVEPAFTQVGVHGGGSEDEMRVPLVVAGVP